jgi:hypothetical protein
MFLGSRSVPEADNLNIEEWYLLGCYAVWRL